MINKIRIKEYINNKGFRLNNDVLDKIEEDLIVVIDRAIERVEENDRKTLFPKDL